MNIKPHIDTIKKLNCIESSIFKYETKIWQKLNIELKNHIKDYENKDISRKNIIECFEDYYSGKINYSIPFGLTMVWGFSNTGYGTYRTNKYYSNEENKKIIKNSFDYVKNGKIEFAYKELQKIDGLNISYISKLLYFASRANKSAQYCLIYDIRVARSLVKLTCPQEIYELLEITPSSKYSNYEKYNNLMHKTAKENNIEAEALEMFLFEQKF